MILLVEQFLNSIIWESYFPLLAGTGVILTLMTALAAWHYIKTKKMWYYIITAVYILSFLTVILTDNWFFFLFGWELVTLTTTFLLAWSSWKLVKQYFVIQFAGSSILLFAVLTANAAGYAKIGVIDSFWLQFLLIMGVGMKSGLFGFHFWLPPIHSEAPAPVSAILSGWVVKLGYIFLLKIIPIETGNPILFFLGFTMIVYAGWKAFRSSDLKVMLAYSTVSQLGFIALAVGIGGKYGFLGAVLHIIAHGFAKTSLFIASGIWQKEFGSRVFYDFKDAVLRRPVSGIVTILGFSSLSGVIFTAGYNSKYLIKSAHSSGFLNYIIFFLLGLLTFFYAGRTVYWIFFNKNNGEYSSESLLKDISSYPIYKTDLAALLIGGIALIVVGLFPEIPGSLIPQLADKDFHILSGIRDTIIYLAVVIFVLKRKSGFVFEVREDLSLEKYLQSFLNFVYKIGKKSIKFDTEKIFEIFFYNAIFNGARKLYNFIYQDFSIQILWIPIFLTVLLLWNQIYSFFN
ncbi:NADH-quinone oxidoreductase subunit M [Halanaerobium sp. DL-01]|uniref:complex I subunit 5 family protein n=1 Tax=Halanaerobium sp. DL-01 TaxID=1653064 RepID=UPI000DF1ABEE|nr:complex I subunit 5 family protein [Halanaerobium sp. DL-01]RCW88554.1 NADH-quinone oxidoreductase subunit M [Halanaerobium sp. DL-01]